MCGYKCRTASHSIRPFATAQWSASGLERISLRSGFLPSYIQSATYLTAPLPSSPYRQHTRTTQVTVRPITAQ